MNKKQLQADRALRDSAKALVKADVAHVKSLLGGASLGKRAIARVSDGASEVLDHANEAASSHRGVVIALFGAIALWFARNPLLSLFEKDASGNDCVAGNNAGDAKDIEDEAPHWDGAKD